MLGTPTETMPPVTLTQLLRDPHVEHALAMAARMVGLPQATVVTIVEAGLPLMATIADENPYVFKVMYAQAMNARPEASPQLSEQLMKTRKAQHAMLAAFQALYGPMTEVLAGEAARQSGATVDQAAQVLAATMPVAVRAVGRENTNQNEMGFGRHLRSLRQPRESPRYEDHSSASPGPRLDAI
jgi:hypothetical protein